ncbi:class I SAM-dependent methyltransferase [Paenalkalicoccus suaedae]|uniref:Class I SAM-dependent methyltransferase n=1 Tax=Paenalkalicoccus suaedae TaxID=2592382 RepID=A0A859FF25_9BACI|nr:class I SAM-dependent methyltransferase [Paenalkalicoccus suaedae]QKS70836.1 class I SAM-dependent methyltransferase [Paenalkalicoccus suaedae]
MSEEHFASVYDVLMEDAPYAEWLEYATSRIPANSSVLDVACGTGTFTRSLARQGYKVSGTDLSMEMLTIAEEKSRVESLSIPYYRQNMTELAGFNDLDAVTLFCDGLNYLTSEKEVEKTFKHIALSLKKGGIFLFDVHSPYKMEHVFDHQLYGENGEEISYLWFCEPGEEPLSVHHSLTFFIKQANGTYMRKDEDQYQRTFIASSYERWLKDAGFIDIEITSEFGRASVHQNDDRIFFKAVKK